MRVATTASSVDAPPPPQPSKPNPALQAKLRDLEVRVRHLTTEIDRSLQEEQALLAKLQRRIQQRQAASSLLWPGKTATTSPLMPYTSSPTSPSSTAAATVSPPAPRTTSISRAPRSTATTQATTTVSSSLASLLAQHSNSTTKRQHQEPTVPSLVQTRPASSGGLKQDLSLRQQGRGRSSAVHSTSSSFTKRADPIRHEMPPKKSTTATTWPKPWQMPPLPKEEGIPLTDQPFTSLVQARRHQFSNMLANKNSNNKNSSSSKPPARSTDTTKQLRHGTNNTRRNNNSSSRQQNPTCQQQADEDFPLVVQQSTPASALSGRQSIQLEHVDERQEEDDDETFDLDTQSI